MGNVSKLNVNKYITKPQIKIAVKDILYSRRPDLRQFVTDKVLSKSMVYISGYIKCINYHNIQPVNKNELRELLIEEVLDWVEYYVDNGGK